MSDNPKKPSTIKVEVEMNFNQYKRGDILTIEDNAQHRKLVQAGNFRLIPIPKPKPAPKSEKVEKAEDE